MPEDTQNTDVETVETDPVDNQGTSDEQNETKKPSGKKYTDDDVNRIVQQKLDRERERQKAELDEAKKLAKMNAQEKQKYELEKVKQEAQNAQDELATYRMRDTASEMFAEQGITPDKGALDLVTTSTAEGTSANVEKLITFAQAIKEQTTKELTKGSTPRVDGAGRTMTREDIMNITDPNQRQQAIADNLNLFNNFN